MSGLGNSSLITPLTGYDTNGSGGTGQGNTPGGQAMYYPAQNQNTNNQQTSTQSYDPTYNAGDEYSQGSTWFGPSSSASQGNQYDTSEWE